MEPAAPIKKHLLRQFNSTYNTNVWFVSFSTAVAGLNETQAHYKPQADIHSIYEVVTHLVFWNEEYLNKLRSLPLKKVDNNEITFSISRSSGWNELLVKAEEVFAGWQTELENITDEVLASDNWQSIIGDLCAHNAYHIGQIVLLRKLQSAWDSKQGVS